MSNISKNDPLVRKLTGRKFKVNGNLNGYLNKGNLQYLADSSEGIGNYHDSYNSLGGRNAVLYDDIKEVNENQDLYDTHMSSNGMDTRFADVKRTPDGKIELVDYTYDGLRPEEVAVADSLKDAKAGLRNTLDDLDNTIRDGYY